MTAQELQQMAREVHDAVYGNALSVEQVVVRVMNYILVKEEAAQKKTAKLFLNEIMSRVAHIDTAYGEICFAVETKDILEIAKEKFGVEVEE